jgi:drug/metabolite transporter (DMT)-like permease
MQTAILKLFPWAQRARSDAHAMGIMLLFCMFIFDGTYAPLSKILRTTLSPWTLFVASEGLAALFIVIAIGFVPLLRAIMRMSVKDIAFAMLIGIISSGIAPLLWFTGIARTTAINASILSGSEFIFVLIFSLIFLKESLNRYQVFSEFMALSGMLILSIGDTIGAVHAQIGDIMIIAAMAAYGFGVVIFKKWLSHVDPEVMLFLRYASGVVIVLAISGLLGFSVGPEIAALPSSMIIMLFVFAFFSRFLSLSCFYGALERLLAVTCGFMLSTLPVSGPAVVQVRRRSS